MIATQPEQKLRAVKRERGATLPHVRFSPHSDRTADIARGGSEPKADATRFHIDVPESGHSALIENIPAEPPQQVRQLADARRVRRARTVCGVCPTPLTGRRKPCTR
jgi:hypothetical protein